MDERVRLKKRKKFKFWKALRKAFVNASAIAVSASAALAASGGEAGAREALGVGGLSAAVFVIRFFENFDNVRRHNNKL